MATEDIWPAVERLAAVWSGSELVQEFLARHPARTDATDSVTESLRNLQAGTWVLTQMPLVTAMWEPLAAQQPLVQLTDELRSYLRTVAPLGLAVESMVCWARSRLPLYPKIPVPQFSSRGFRRTEEFGTRLSWRQQCLASGLEIDAAPPGVANILKIGEAALQSSSQDVLEVLMSSTEWQTYSDLASTMTAADVEVLDAARRRVGVLLNPTKVNEYEDARMERRHAYRKQQVQLVVDELEGRPRELADAFDVIDDLIDHALVNVHGQLVVSGKPPIIDPADLEVEGAQVSFRFHGDNAPGVGESTRLNDVLVPGLVLIDGISFQFGQSEGGWIAYTGQRLPGSQDAFLSQ